MNPVLQVKQVEKYFGRANNLTRALNQISFEVQPGEFVAIMGASGSGKTTLLNCIATIDQVSSGQIIVANQDITKLKGNKLNQFRQKQIGFIFQDFNLLDTMNAFENIALALTIRNVPAKQVEEKVLKVASYLGITDILYKFPYEVSGGQKQRIAAARAIVADPAIVLADEPTGALDSKSARQMLEQFELLNERLNSTILMVTHDAFTASYTNRVLFVKDGQIFNEIYRGESSRKEFFDQIIEVVALLGGDVNDVR
ncbi:ABC transporter ATP-binding protein [Enterococcus cecorum]|uniref:ABC transporter ATP-binding protein n=1 Tax=Enterococcus cecorum TaxID=44008 RepID=UPI0006433738|nr:ABC transporter ATP-binding protein [Enterococcus cecorum]KLO70328.1 multidrug ABC transporter ATP-binding protein [Enterococcus cecorum]MCJ0579542.1 ABC transporter ATP-binding protein [Enterococcus cecorum]MDZ5576872.1 ABC transporter ATP-binding protein [Enterococcus cecorum]CAI3302994.1 ABC transporter ATP-binding protein [Enterococcus cecorum]CAI3386616.1 ABC transporter ATP-binding protein [Enterococcus cecorum]